ncbi:transglycosylase SLT domain-containing protein, partial [Staphylococcus epidermidis]
SNNGSSHNYSTKTTSYSAPSTSSASTGGSTKAQFLANGGTEEAWNAIVMPESGGNPNAVNPAGYRGLGQTMESWGTGSVASQTKGMLNYAN